MKEFIISMVLVTASLFSFGQAACTSPVIIATSPTYPPGTNCLCTNPCSSAIASGPPPASAFIKQSDYNCHQYVRAAMDGKVDTATGLPNVSDSGWVTDYCTSTIRNDQNFIRICETDRAYARALTPTGNSTDHSALILDGGTQFASTPSGSDDSIMKSSSEFNCGTGAGSYELYAYIPQIVLATSPYAVYRNDKITLTLATNNSTAVPSYLSFDYTKVSYNTTDWQEDSHTSTSLTLSQKSSIQMNYNYSFTYTLTTGCTVSPLEPTRTKTIQVMENCEGTLDTSGPLNTFNSVCSGVNHKVEMFYAGPWTWVKTSGTVNYWNTASSGKIMNFSISSGCATFNAYNAYCNVTRTFCATSCFGRSASVTTTDYKVLNLYSNQIEKIGSIEDTEDTKAMTEGLSPGFYVVFINEERRKVIVGNR